MFLVSLLYKMKLPVKSNWQILTNILRIFLYSSQLIEKVLYHLFFVAKFSIKNVREKQLRKHNYRHPPGRKEHEGMRHRFSFVEFVFAYTSKRYYIPSASRNLEINVSRLLSVLSKDSYQFSI